MYVIALLSVFVLACVVGAHAVQSVAPALHMPLVVATSAIGSIIIVGALIVTAEATGLPRWLGLAGVAFAAANIFGGFAVVERMLATAREKGRK